MPSTIPTPQYVWDKDHNDIFRDLVKDILVFDCPTGVFTVGPNETRYLDLRTISYSWHAQFGPFLQYHTKVSVKNLTSSAINIIFYDGQNDYAKAIRKTFRARKFYTTYINSDQAEITKIIPVKVEGSFDTLALEVFLRGPLVKKDGTPL